MQSNNLSAVINIRDAYETDHERYAFAAGYFHAHGIACHNVPKVGQTYYTKADGSVTPEDADEAREVHAELCYAAEANDRSFSPWEYTAKEINDLDESERDDAWNAYEEGVAAAIMHDIEDYTSEDYE